MKRFRILMGLLAFACAPCFSMAQTSSQSAANIQLAHQEFHSGIVHLASDHEAYSLIKLHCDELQLATTVAAIERAFSSYSDLIHSWELDPAEHKLYVKYTTGMTPNFLLAILERSAVIAYFKGSAGQSVYYAKDPGIHFRK
jgi:hypothetical protein